MLWEFPFLPPQKMANLRFSVKIFMKKFSTVIIFFSKVNFVIPDNSAQLVWPVNDFKKFNRTRKLVHSVIFWWFLALQRLYRPFLRILSQNDFFAKEVQLIMFSQCVLRFLISLLVSEIRSDETSSLFIDPYLRN